MFLHAVSDKILANLVGTLQTIVFGHYVIRDLDILDRVWWRATKIFKGAECFFCEERQREQTLFRLKRRRLR